MLDRLRAGVLKKLAGLSESRNRIGEAADDARRSTVESCANVAGLVQHLTFVESLWFEEIAAGGKARRGDRSMAVDLRSVLLAVIEETARHAGHADIIREQIDGQTGR